MKKNNLLLLSMVLFTCSVFAQIKYDIKDTEQLVKKGFQVMLPGSSVKDAEASIKDFLKAYKPKIDYADKTKTEWLASQAIMPTLNAAPVDIYFNVQPSGNDATLYIFFNLGNSYVSADVPDKHAAAMAIVKQITAKIAFDKTQVQIDSTINQQKILEKELSVLESDQQHIESTIEKNKKSIVDDQNKMKENERAIEKSKSDQLALTAEISTEKTALESMNPDALRERIKTLESEIKDLGKTNEKLNADIASKKGEITTKQSLISANKGTIGINTKQVETLRMQKSQDAGSGLDPKVVKERIKILDDQLKDIAKTNEKLTNDNVKLEGDIQSIYVEISTANGQIQNNQIDMQNKTKEKTETQQKITDNSLDERIKKLEEMQKSEDHMTKEQEKYTKDNDEIKSNIEKLNQENLTKETVDIEKSKSDQATKTKAIDKVKLAVQELKVIQQSYLDVK
jgi:chromosome segregation ATPase